MESMNLNEFKEEVHRNAIEHGWWGPEYTDATVIALIHAEISEAFEEWRAGRPMLWHECGGTFWGRKIVCEMYRCPHIYEGKSKRDCTLRQDKPEGIAAELIDVVLRILDTAAAWNVEIGPVTTGVGKVQEMDLPTLTATLHYEVNRLFDPFLRLKNEANFGRMTTVISYIASWLDDQGVDAAAILREKHAYNVTRPFKHGGKKC